MIFAFLAVFALGVFTEMNVEVTRYNEGGRVSKIAVFDCELVFMDKAREAGEKEYDTDQG